MCICLDPDPLVCRAKRYGYAVAEWQRLYGTSAVCACVCHKNNKENSVSETSAFEQHCIVELFGRSKLAGRVTEQVIAGQGFIRVDVPATKRHPEFSRFFGPSAVYSMTPISVELVQAAAEQIWVEPITVYIEPSHQIEHIDDDDEDDI